MSSSTALRKPAIATLTYSSSRIHSARGDAYSSTGGSNQTNIAGSWLQRYCFRCKRYGSRTTRNRSITHRYLPALALRSFLFLPIRPPILLPALFLSPAVSDGVAAALSDLPPVRAFLLGRSPVSPSPDFSRRGLPLPSLGGLDSRLMAGRPSSSESSSVGRDLRLRSGAPPPCRASPTFSTRRLTTCRT
jgi:hypothetical protein